MSCHTPFRKPPPARDEKGMLPPSLTLFLTSNFGRLDYNECYQLSILELDYQRSFMLVRYKNTDYRYQFTWGGMCHHLLGRLYLDHWDSQFQEGTAPPPESEEFEQYFTTNFYLFMERIRLGGGWRPKFILRPSAQAVNDSK